MNTYIQDKLDELKKVYKCDDNDKSFFPFGGDDYDFSLENCEKFLKQSLTDYHNHIVEKLLKHFDKLEHNDTNDSMENWRNYKFIRNNIVDCLQDTNPKE